MLRVAICVLVLFANVWLTPRRADAQEPAAPEKQKEKTVVLLDRSRAWSMQTGTETAEGLLARELMRQTFLIAARDQLGLQTRDIYLGEPISGAGELPILELTAVPGFSTQIELLRGTYPVQEVVDSLEMKLGSPLDYRVLLEIAEEFSRGRLVEMLQKAGYWGKPNHAANDEVGKKTGASVDEKTATYLEQMSLDGQYLAVRRLHSAIAEQGESPELLEALARGYVNLGVLSERQWAPAHKVFMARSLLYAQRRLVKDSKSPSALLTRGYVAALNGFHAWALDDLAKAAALREQLPEQERPALPDWVDLISKYCRADVLGLQAVPDTHKHFALARLLFYLASEESGDDAASTAAL
jgi:hypothetical protein